MLRAIALAARLDFAVDGPVIEAIRECRKEIARSAPARLLEEYFKIQLGPLERLSRPVVAEKWKRLTFLYTTGEYLLKAKTLNDLVVQNDERQLLWQL